MNETYKNLAIGAIIGIPSTIFGAALYALIADGDLIRNWTIVIATLAMLGLGLLFIPLFRRLLIPNSGLVEFKKDCSVPQGVKYWKYIKTDLIYVGVTGNSIQKEIEIFIKNETGERFFYRFLLMKPDGAAFRKQIAYKNGYDLAHVTTEQELKIKSESNSAQQNLLAFIAMIKASRAWMSMPKRVEIRLYDEFTPWWLYIINRSKIILGMIITDNYSNADPIVVLNKNTKGTTNLYSVFEKNFERLWDTGISVEVN